MIRNLRASAFLGMFLTVAGAVALHAQSAVEIVGRNEPIPSGFQSYSLFLICNPQWLDPEKSNGLVQLYHQFQAFGRSIGDDQAAVWFWRTTVKVGWEAYSSPADIIDVERSVRFCSAWKLKPSDGPYVVITSDRPDENILTETIPGKHAVYALGNMNPAAISALLAKLTDSLLLSGTVDSSTLPAPAASSPAAAAPQSPDSLWVRMLTATQQSINSFGCAWSFKIDAGPVTADLKSCKGAS